MSNEASWKGEFRFFKNFEKKIILAELGPKTCFYPPKNGIFSYNSVNFQYFLKKTKLTSLY